MVIVMNRSEYVLAILSATQGKTLTPVQVQKLFFVLDKEASAYTGGPHFSFSPYDYGPFDSQVYSEIESLKDGGLAIRIGSAIDQYRSYGLTPEGQTKGENFFQQFDDQIKTYVNELVAFIKGQSFSGLVSAIYKAYPDMKVNSVFKD